MYSIRYYDYLDTYLELILKYYATEQKGVLCNYWHFNKDESIIEDYYHTDSGSYEIFGINSGYRWDKILFLPVNYSENTQIEKDFKEHGIERDVKISVTIPDQYGLIPSSLDFLTFISNFQLEGEETPTFRVRGISESHFGKHKFYKLNLDTDYAATQNLENQKVNNYIFVELMKKIYGLDDGEIILNSQLRLKQLSDITKFFSNKLLLYKN